jgi:Uma2 family endonuclease
MSNTTTSIADMPEPEWEVARLFPGRGAWTEEEYLDLGTNHIVEFSNGCLDVQSMPTESHQLIVRFLFDTLWAFVRARGLGSVLFAARPVRLWRRKFCEPDVLFMKAENSHRRTEKFWKGADLVMEVVSSDPKDRERDLVTKRYEYSRAGVPEYWIVDPQEQRIVVLALSGGTYRVHGELGPGVEASSALLPEFRVAVGDVFAAATA